MRLTENHPELGRHVTYTRDGHPPVTGTITGVEEGHVIRNVKTGERWAGVKLRIKPDSGARAIWTMTVKADPPVPAENPA